MKIVSAPQKKKIHDTFPALQRRPQRHHTSENKEAGPRVMMRRAGQEVAYKIRLFFFVKCFWRRKLKYYSKIWFTGAGDPDFNPSNLNIYIPRYRRDLMNKYVPVGTILFFGFLLLFFF